MRGRSRQVSLASGVTSLMLIASAGAASEPTELVSVRQAVTTSQTPDGNSFFSPRGSMSRDARFVVFSSNADGLVPGHENSQLLGPGIFVRDRETGTTTQLRYQSGAFPGAEASISDDGRFVAFTTFPVYFGVFDSPPREQIFVFDRQSNTVEQISRGMNNAKPDAESLTPMISGNGRYVVYTSRASNLVPGDTNGTLDIEFRHRVENPIIDAIEIIQE
jgi:Tol biopolymer transport system component